MAASSWSRGNGVDSETGVQSAIGMTSDQMTELQRIAEAAVLCEQNTDFPAEVSAAQCILESAWLTRAPGNNCFGIKATDENERYCLTKEYLDGSWQTCKAAFETYPTLAACFIAHAKLLTTGSRYAAAWASYLVTWDLGGFIRAIAPIYATDPNYASEILTLVRGPHVTAAIRAAREAA